MTFNQEDEPIYTRTVAAQLAQISLDFLRQCEQKELVQVRVMRGGGLGYSTLEIRRLARIRRLHGDLELDFVAIEVTLNLHRQVTDLQAQLEEMERRMHQREQELQRELHHLRRRLALESEWQ